MEVGKPPPGCLPTCEDLPPPGIDGPGLGLLAFCNIPRGVEDAVMVAIPSESDAGRRDGIVGGFEELGDVGASLFWSSVGFC